MMISGGYKIFHSLMMVMWSEMCVNDTAHVTAAARVEWWYIGELIGEIDFAHVRICDIFHSTGDLHLTSEPRTLCGRNLGICKSDRGAAGKPRESESTSQWCVNVFQQMINGDTLLGVGWKLFRLLPLFFLFGNLTLEWGFPFPAGASSFSVFDSSSLHPMMMMI